MSILFYVILFYKILLPLYFPLSDFVNSYGTGSYKTVSDDLKSMRYFYEMYPDAVISPQVEDELIADVNRPLVGG